MTLKPLAVACALASVLILAACSSSSSSSTGPGDTLTEDVVSLEGLEFEFMDKDLFEAGPEAESSGDAVEEAEIVKGMFGSPCQGNLDCLSGYCILGPEGYICTEPCETTCPGDFTCRGVATSGTDVVFICMPNIVPVCLPCTVDVQCNGGICADLGAEKTCVVPCDGDACAEGFTCVDSTAGQGETARVCAPTSGTCSCTAGAVGIQRSCHVDNQVGTCYGVETCGETGWGPCSATPAVAEDCDGLDNDCNGLVDEGLAGGEPCENTVEGVGTCPGVRQCLGGAGWSCEGRKPADESCDYVDNDCDGATDEGFADELGRYTQFEHCGDCYTSCEKGFPNATAVCNPTYDPPACTVSQCAAGYYKLNDFQCIPQGLALCAPCASAEQCLMDQAACLPIGDGTFCTRVCGQDGDCPAGFFCDLLPGSGANKYCQPQTGTCACTSTNLGFARPCSMTYDPPDPALPSYTCSGQMVCGEEGWGPCAMPAEVCDDVDNNCDGQVDEGFVDQAGKYDTNENCGKCGKNCAAFSYPFASGVCDASGDVPTCAMQCDPDHQDTNHNPADGCECAPVPGPDTPDAVSSPSNDTNCDGIDGELENAVFVSKDGNDLNPGTLAEPKLTIQAGIQAAQEAARRDVYVATGVYNENVRLLPGARVYGGYSADFAVRTVPVYETVIMGVKPDASHPGAVTVDGTSGGSLTELDGFIVYGYTDKAPGATSYGIYVRNADETLRIINNRVLAGNGGDGTRGGHGSSGEGGVAGTGGADARDIGHEVCVAADESAGGAGGGKQCGGSSVSGGAGGRAICPDFDNDTSYDFCPSSPLQQTLTASEAGKDGQGAGAGQGAGGAAGSDAWIFGTCYTCFPNDNNCWSKTPVTGDCSLCRLPDGSMPGADGVKGQDGAHGAAGAGCAEPAGGVTGGLWANQPGLPGGLGANGGGGGGGGAGGGVDTWHCADASTLFTDMGGSGGGGGSGGCGATGGLAGGPGGGSFGIFVVFDSAPASLPQILGNSVAGGNGGDGGNGGNGGTGGPGGDGGPGGLSGSGTDDAFCAAQGGHGGRGGYGGHGGGGGGGCGGPAYGLFVAGQGDLPLDAWKSGNLEDAPGSGGQGGAGGSSLGNAGQAGLPGSTSFTNF
jgi:hypothetical protein